MKASIALRTGAGLAGVAMLAAACGTSGSSTATSSTAKASSAPTTTAGSTAATTTSVTATPAANLRAALDMLLREHVDLTTTVVQTATATGLSSPQTTAAVATLDQNTQALGSAIGSIYGSAAQKTFLQEWNAHIASFVTYTKGMATNNPTLVAQGNQGLSSYITSFAAFLHGATGLPTSALTADLQGHVQTLKTAIDAIVAKSPSAGSAVQMAAEHMDGTAQVLAQGIASSKHISGNPNGAGSALRAALTGMLVQHVAATGFVVQNAVQYGLSAPQTAGAIQALTSNTNHLGAAIGSIYGAAAEQQFLQMWNAHIGYFITYTKGEATGNATMKAQANQQLQGYVTSFSQFLATATKGKLSASAAAADLQGHVQTLEAAINAIVTKQPDAASKLAMAESHMAGTAAVLSSAIAAEFPSKFTN